MGVSVTLHASCDVFLAKKGSTVKKKCANQGSWHEPNIVECRRTAESVGWRFNTAGAKDKAMCPECGPAVQPHLYGKRS